MRFSKFYHTLPSSCALATMEMMLKLYNTLTRKVEEFKPLNPPRVGFYSCGPTVYEHTHIGHMRAYTFVDTLRRTLEANGFEVEHVMNITDVGHLFEEGEEKRLGEDKLEYEAKKEKMSAWDIAKKYTDEFLQVLDELNIKKPQIMPRATDHIKEQIDLIKQLEKKGFTYVVDRGVAFDTSKFPHYPDFARLNLKKMKKGARIEFDPQKKNPADFWLWRFSDPKEKRQMEWDSPWGRGFPGWHIECSAMSMKYLGDTFDIHTGGVDHIGVHHTNEIAQSQGATGKPFVRFWLHNEFILIDGKKMSRSLGNVYTLEDIKKKGFEPLAVRYLFLTAHYRDKLNFTWKSLTSAQSAYEKLKAQVPSLESQSRTALSEEKLQKIEDYKNKFFSLANNDLGTPQALAVVWEVLKSNIPAQDKRELLLSFDEVLGLGLAEVKPERVKVSKEVQELVEEREKLRTQEKWQEADKLRKRIEKAGFNIEDTPKGPKVKKR